MERRKDFQNNCAAIASGGNVKLAMRHRYLQEALQHKNGIKTDRLVDQKCSSDQLHADWLERRAIVR